MGKDLGEEGRQRPKEVVWHDEAPEGKLDLLVTLDFRMSTTCVYSDIVLPTATWYEKNDLNTSDMHPFIHPLSAAVDPAWESQQRLGNLQGHRQEVLRGRARSARRREGRRAASRSCTTPPARWRSPSTSRTGRQGESSRSPARPCRNVAVVERDYPNLYKRFTALGPLMDKLGNGGKGIAWKTEHEVEVLGRAERRRRRGRADQGHAAIETDIDAAEVILMLAPETNGEVAVKAWEALSQGHRPRARPSRAAQGRREDPLPRHRRPAAQDHLLADLVGHREREGLLQRRLHQRARADPVAHAHRAPAALPGSSVDAGLRRGLLRLPAAGRPQDRQPGDRQQAQRQPAGRAELHHPAPEVGHPLHLYRQPADADAEPRRAGGLDLGDRRGEGRHRRQRLGRGLQRQRRARRPRGGLPAHEGRNDLHVPRAGEDREHARLADHRQARRHPQLGDPHHPQADPHDRRLRAAGLRLQLLRHGRLQPRRVRRSCARWTRSTGSSAPTTTSWKQQNEDPRADRHGAEPRQVHRLPHLLGHLQERVDQPRGRRIRLVQQRRDQARHRLSQGLGEPEEVERRLGSARPTARSSRASAPSGASWPRSSPTPTCPRSTTTTSRSTSTTTTCSPPPRSRPSRPRVRARRSPASAWRRSSGARTGRRSWAASSPSARRTTTSKASRRRSTASSRTPS